MQIHMVGYSPYYLTLRSSVSELPFLFWFMVHLIKVMHGWFRNIQNIQYCIYDF